MNIWSWIKDTFFTKKDHTSAHAHIFLKEAGIWKEIYEQRLMELRPEGGIVISFPNGYPIDLCPICKAEEDA